MTTEDKKGLNVIGINKDFGEIQAVKDVTLEVLTGEFFLTCWVLPAVVKQHCCA